MAEERNEKICNSIDNIFVFTNNLCFAVENTKLLLEKNGKEYTKCQHFFENEKQNCQESWSMKCYNYLISLTKKHKIVTSMLLKIFLRNSMGNLKKNVGKNG